MNSNATANNVANLQPIPSQIKPQTSREVIQQNVQLLIEQLEQGHSEALTHYLTTMGRFHRYSLGNILEIARQKPDAQRVAGLYAWNQLGRRVNKGQKGIRILAPMIGTRKRKDSETSEDPAVTHKPLVIRISFGLCVRHFTNEWSRPSRVRGQSNRRRGRVPRTAVGLHYRPGHHA